MSAVPTSVAARKRWPTSTLPPSTPNSSGRRVARAPLLSILGLPVVLPSPMSSRTSAQTQLTASWPGSLNVSPDAAREYDGRAALSDAVQMQAVTTTSTAAPKVDSALNHEPP
jgi:hypothetical protein